MNVIKKKNNLIFDPPFKLISGGELTRIQIQHNNKIVLNKKGGPAFNTLKTRSLVIGPYTFRLIRGGSNYVNFSWAVGAKGTLRGMVEGQGINVSISDLYKVVSKKPKTAKATKDTEARTIEMGYNAMGMRDEPVTIALVEVPVIGTIYCWTVTEHTNKGHSIRMSDLNGWQTSYPKPLSILSGDVPLHAGFYLKGDKARVQFDGTNFISLDEGRPAHISLPGPAPIPTADPALYEVIELGKAKDYNWRKPRNHTFYPNDEMIPAGMLNWGKVAARIDNHCRYQGRQGDRLAAYQEANKMVVKPRSVMRFEINHFPDASWQSYNGDIHPSRAAKLEYFYSDKKGAANWIFGRTFDGMKFMPGLNIRFDIEYQMDVWGSLDRRSNTLVWDEPNIAHGYDAEYGNRDTNSQYDLEDRIRKSATAFTLQAPGMEPITFAGDLHPSSTLLMDNRVRYWYPSNAVEIRAWMDAAKAAGQPVGPGMKPDTTGQLDSLELWIER